MNPDASSGIASGCLRPPLRVQDRDDREDDVSLRVVIVEVHEPFVIGLGDRVKPGLVLRAQLIEVAQVAGVKDLCLDTIAVLRFDSRLRVPGF
jgi:hypothetical protein